MATNGGEERKLALGEIVEFKAFNDALAKLDRTELYNHPMLTNPGVLGEWLHSTGLDEGEADGLHEHLNDHIGKHPLREALTAGAWFALLKSANDDQAPKFYLRVARDYGVVVGNVDCEGPMAVVVNVRPDWPYVPVGVPGVGWSKLKAELRRLALDEPMMQGYTTLEATGLHIQAPPVMA